MEAKGLVAFSLSVIFLHSGLCGNEESQRLIDPDSFDTPKLYKDDCGRRH